MDEREWLAEPFEANRTHLRAVAYRMLGSVSEADDAVQEAWLRLSRSNTAEIKDMRAWLTNRINELEQERTSRWQKILQMLTQGRG